MNVLITGIEGFVAPYLAELFAGTDKVYGTYFLKPANKINGISCLYMDITDVKSVNETIALVKPDMIFHLAGFSSIAESWKTPELAFKINADGTKNLLDAVATLGLDPRILLVSSADVYGNPNPLPVSEDAALNPITPYGKSRHKQEKIAASYANLHIVIARSFNHTGPGQPPKFACPSFAMQVARIEHNLQEPVIKHGDLSIRRDFSDVRDVVRAYKLLAEKGKKHNIYNVCSGKSYSMKEILALLMSMSSVNIKTEEDPALVRPTDIPELVGSNAKLCKDTGWGPAIEFKQTLKDMLEYWRKKV